MCKHNISVNFFYSNADAFYFLYVDYSKEYTTFLHVTWVWISSFIERLASCFFFTANSSTRGLMVMPYETQEKMKELPSISVLYSEIVSAASYHSNPGEGLTLML